MPFGRVVFRESRQRQGLASHDLVFADISENLHITDIVLLSMTQSDESWTRRNDAKKD
jgi:hypothetical protein